MADPQNTLSPLSLPVRGAVSAAEVEAGDLKVTLMGGVLIISNGGATEILLNAEALSVTAPPDTAVRLALTDSTGSSLLTSAPPTPGGTVPS